MLSLYDEEVFKIKNYSADGFEKICDVELSYGDWKYTNIDEELMYANHESWVYFVVVDGIIVKAGETGNPIGIKSSTVYGKWTQPLKGTKCRFGRLSSGDNTDYYLRESIRPFHAQNKSVELWAKKCDMYVVNEVIFGEKKKVITTTHKNLEQIYLNNFKNTTGLLPKFNKSTK